MLLFSGQEVRADIQTNVGVSRIAPLPDKIAPINAPFPMSPLKRPVFPDRSFNITDYGAKGDGTTKNTEPFRNAIAACNAAGGGRVIVPAGQWFTGRDPPQEPRQPAPARKARKSISVDDPQDYLPVVFTRWAGFEVMNYSPLDLRQWLREHRHHRPGQTLRPREQMVGLEQAAG